MYDIIIVGGGCAGLTAAIYARRAAKSVLLFENQSYGGQISFSPSVENYPGFTDISGFELSDKMYEQISALGTKTSFETVIGIKIDGKAKTVITDSGEYTCKAVIIAAGLKHRKLGLDNEEKLTGHGVSYCAVCDGAFFKGRDVAVCGGGNTALQDAVFLADLCKSVTLIHRRDTFRADAHIIASLKEKSNVKYILNSNITALNGDNMLHSVTVADKLTGKTHDIEISGLFVAVGHIPQNDPFKSLVKLDEYGFIIAGEDCRTSADGIFAAGDCRVKEIRQLTTAAADGAVAATNACRYIDLV